MSLDRIRARVVKRRDEGTKIYPPGSSYFLSMTKSNFILGPEVLSYFWDTSSVYHQQLFGMPESVFESESGKEVRRHTYMVAGLACVIKVKARTTYTLGKY